MQTLGRSMAKPVRSPDAGEKMDVVERKWLVLPLIDHAMRGSDDNIGRDQGSRAFHLAPVAGDVDLADRAPRGARLLDDLRAAIRRALWPILGAGSAAGKEQQREARDTGRAAQSRMSFCRHWLSGRPSPRPAAANLV